MLAPYMGLSLDNTKFLMQAVANTLRQRRKAERQQSNPQGSMLRQISHRRNRRGIRTPAGIALMWRP